VLEDVVPLLLCGLERELPRVGQRPEVPDLEVVDCLAVGVRERDEVVGDSYGRA